MRSERRRAVGGASASRNRQFESAIAALIIDLKFDWAALFAGAGAILSFFGFIHGASLGIGSSAPVALGYLIIAGFCFVLSRQRYPQAVLPAEPAIAGED